MVFADRIALITGASSGIGWELALELARRKCHVALLARRQDKLEELARQCQALGVRAVVAPCDVTDRQAMFEAIARVQEALGPIDLLIANSGMGVPTNLDPMNWDDVDRMIRVNYLGVVYAIETVLPQMLARGRGHLAAVSSLAAYKGMPGESGYCSSKAAVNTFLEGLRIQLRTRGIHVTTICAGFVLTAMTAKHEFTMPFLLQPPEAARRIVRALERRTKVFNFPWPTWVLMKLTGWVPDWILAQVLTGYTGDSVPSKAKRDRFTPMVPDSP